MQSTLTTGGIIGQSAFILSMISFIKGIMKDDKIPSKSDSLLQLAAIAHTLNMLRKGKYAQFVLAMCLFLNFSIGGSDKRSVVGHLINLFTFHRASGLKLPPHVPMIEVLKYSTSTHPLRWAWKEHRLEEMIEKASGPAAMFIAPVNRKYWTKAGTQLVFISDPDMVEEVMSNKDAFPTRGDTGFTDFVGEGLLGLPSGEMHSFHRRVITKFLSDNYLKVFGKSIEEEIEKFLGIWGEKATTKEPVDAYYDLSLLTLDVIMRIAFGIDESELSQGKIKHEDNHLSHGLDYGLKMIVLRTAMPWLKKAHAMIGSQTLLNRYIREHHEMAQRVFDKGVKMVQDNPEHYEKNPTMLSALINAKKEDGSPALNHTEILDELKTLRGAGHETSGNTMCWALYLLQKNPEKLKKLREEADRVLGDRKIATYEDSKMMTYTTAVVYETLRLFPTVPRFPREAAYDTKVGGYDILEGAYVFVSQTAMNHSPKYWKDPEAFIPERFSEKLPELQMTKPVGIPGGQAFGYLPFGSGNRTCVGQRLAMLEQVMILSSLVKRFDWTLAMNESDLHETADVTLGPKDGLWLRISPRKD